MILLKAIVLTINDKEGQGVSKEDVKPIFDLLYSNTDENFDKWFEGSLRTSKEGEEDISLILDDQEDGGVITQALLLHPNFVSIRDYLL